MDQQEPMTMITLSEPHMALNAKYDKRPLVPYNMGNNMEVTSKHEPVNVMAWVATVAKGSDGGKLNALVINCHGRPGALDLGTSITSLEDAKCFAKLQGLVNDIFLISCAVAGVRKSKDGTEMVEGISFCCEIAKQAKARVFASGKAQSLTMGEAKAAVNQGLPKGQIDEFETPAYIFHSDGKTSQSWDGKSYPVASKGILAALDRIKVTLP
jgi:hypothetical protein